MLRLCVVVVTALCFTAVHGRWTWKCQKPAGQYFDFTSELPGSWAVYATNPSRMSTCYNYSINNKRAVREDYFRAIIHTKATENYILEDGPTENSFSLKKKLFNFLPSRTTWELVASRNSKWLLLYSCSLFREESQVWVSRFSSLVNGSKDVPEDIQAAMKKINFKPSDYQLRVKSDCEH